MDRASRHAMQSISETARSEAGCRPAGSRSRVRACVNLWISSDPAGDVREAEWQHDGSLDKLEDQGALSGEFMICPRINPEHQCLVGIKMIGCSTSPAPAAPTRMCPASLIFVAHA